MNVRFYTLGSVAFALLALASSGWADPPAEVRQTPSTERTLRLPETPFRYAGIELPAHFNAPAARRFDNTPRDNPITDAGATLGRVLFYDTRLSAPNMVACASCHRQERAFVDTNRFSKGHEGKLTDRHAPTLGNLRFYQRGRFFWDERAKSLEEQVLQPIQSKVEMGQDLTKLTALLAGDSHYPALYREAFGSSTITSERTAKALAQFLRSLVSYQSKYDEGLAKTGSVRSDFDNFTAEENRGKTIFLNRCATCHLPGGQSAHFFTNRPLNNGLDADTRSSDGGVGDLTLARPQTGAVQGAVFAQCGIHRALYARWPFCHAGRGH
jgi:cytochrome c peroxidase